MEERTTKYAKGTKKRISLLFKGESYKDDYLRDGIIDVLVDIEKVKIPGRSGINRMRR